MKKPRSFPGCVLVALALLTAGGTGCESTKREILQGLERRELLREDKEYRRILGELSDARVAAASVVLSRSHCYGHCQPFFLALRGNGTVELWHDVGPNDRLACKSRRPNATRSISTDKLRKLIARFERVKFRTVPDPDPGGGADDGQAVMLELTLDGQTTSYETWAWNLRYQVLEEQIVATSGFTGAELAPKEHQGSR
jgi:hypothetical protein